jgi:murein L,D-transpeptidase YafK
MLRRQAKIAAALTLLWLASCRTAGVLPQPVAVSRAHVEVPREYELAPFLPWAVDESELIIVDKVSRTLLLYQRGVAVRRYPVVLGRGMGRKVFEGDRRTPSGLYEITWKRPHPKYDRFMLLSYPNDRDRVNYLQALQKGQVPPVEKGGRARGLGGSVGIHGSDKEDLNRVGINWTYGCVSLANRDMEELYSLVGPGAVVLIYDDQQPS